MTDNDRIAELSYAYLHAVAAAAGFGCTVGSRIDDAASVDALVRVNEKLATDSTLFNFSFEVQLKATTKVPTLENGKYSYFFHGIDRYDRLRDPGSPLPKLLVVLFLPQDCVEWVTVDEEKLVARRCAYWVSLHGAPKSDNRSGKTVYIPQAQLLTVDELRAVATQLSKQESLRYAN